MEKIFKKETFLKPVGEPTLQIKKGEVIANVLFIEAESQEAFEALDISQPTTARVRKEYRFTLDEYKKHGDDVWKLGIEQDPQLKEAN